MVSAQHLFSAVHSKLRVSATHVILRLSQAPAQTIKILLKNEIPIFVAAVMILCYVVMFEIKY